MFFFVFSSSPNHEVIDESPRRGETFVTRKITVAAAKIKLALEKGESFKPIQLGNLNAKRDWGHAKEFVKGMFAILEQDEPDDYVLATGETHSVREFVEKTFHVFGIDVKWAGSELDEYGYFVDSEGTQRKLVETNKAYYRPAEVDLLLGDPTKAKEKLGWTPNISFAELVREMVLADYERLK